MKRVKKLTEHELLNIPMKELIWYNTQMYNLYIEEARTNYGSNKFEMAWKEFSKTKPMVKKFNDAYLSDVWDKETQEKSHHMTWIELFSK
jgi:hypothetical protein